MLDGILVVIQVNLGFASRLSSIDCMSLSITFTDAFLGANVGVRSPASMSFCFQGDNSMDVPV